MILGHDERMVARHGTNPPEPEFRRWAAEVSEELWREATEILASGRDVIFDWGFWTRAERDEARRRATALGAATVLYRLECSDAVARSRTLARTAAGGRVLEINGAAWDVFRARFEPPAEDEAAVCVTMD